MNICKAVPESISQNTAVSEAGTYRVSRRSSVEVDMVDRACCGEQ